MSRPPKSAAREGLHRLLVLAGSLSFTTACFLVLPLMQAIASLPESDSLVRSIDTGDVPPPPPPPEEPPPEEEPEDEPPPELTEQAPPLDLSQLELALNPVLGDGWTGGDFAIQLDTFAARSGEGGGAGLDALFSVADLDQKPRAIHQPSPTLNAEARRKAPGTVYVLFTVDPDGRVSDPVVQKSTDPVFEKPALAAVKQWKFEPGKRNGQAVRFRMRVPITFPKG
jgi:protein TonB